MKVLDSMRRSILTVFERESQSLSYLYREAMPRLHRPWLVVSCLASNQSERKQREFHAKIIIQLRNVKHMLDRKGNINLRKDAKSNSVVGGR